MTEFILRRQFCGLFLKLSDFIQRQSSIWRFVWWLFKLVRAFWCQNDLSMVCVAFQNNWNSSNRSASANLENCACGWILTSHLLREPIMKIRTHLEVYFTNFLKNTKNVQCFIKARFSTALCVSRVWMAFTRAASVNRVDVLHEHEKQRRFRFLSMCDWGFAVSIYYFYDKFSISFF